jgi:hypothetical protein
VLGHVSAGTGDARVSERALHEVQRSGWALQYYVPALSFAVGMALLGITAARTRAVPPPAGWLLALGAVLVGTEGLIVSNVYYVTGSATLLAGGLAVALALGRMSDEEFAGGGGAIRR